MEDIFLAAEAGGNLKFLILESLKDFDLPKPFASTIHTGDVGISVDSAVDVAKEAAVLCCSKRT